MPFSRCARALACLAAAGALVPPFAAAPVAAQPSQAVALDCYGDLPAVGEAVLSPSGAYT